MCWEEVIVPRNAPVVNAPEVYFSVVGDRECSVIVPKEVKLESDIDLVGGIAVVTGIVRQIMPLRTIGGNELPYSVGIAHIAVHQGLPHSLPKGHEPTKTDGTNQSSEGG